MVQMGDRIMNEQTKDTILAILARAKTDCFLGRLRIKEGYPISAANMIKYAEEKLDDAMELIEKCPTS